MLYIVVSSCKCLLRVSQRDFNFGVLIRSCAKTVPWIVHNTTSYNILPCGVSGTRHWNRSCFSLATWQEAENGTAKITVFNTRANMTREAKQGLKMPPPPKKYQQKEPDKQPRNLCFWCRWLRFCRKWAFYPWIPWKSISQKPWVFLCSFFWVRGVVDDFDQLDPLNQLQLPKQNIAFVIPYHVWYIYKFAGFLRHSCNK